MQVMANYCEKFQKTVLYLDCKECEEDGRCHYKRKKKKEKERNEAFEKISIHDNPV